MNFSKIDAPLANSIQDNKTNNLNVFIHMVEPLTNEQVQFLHRIGIVSASPGKKIITSSLSVDKIEILVNQEWIQIIKSGSANRQFN